MAVVSLLQEPCILFYFILFRYADIILVLQQNRLRWYGNVLRKDDDD